MVITSAKAVPLTVLKFSLPDWSRQTTTPNLGQDGMYAQPDQSAAFSEGFSQGYLGVPFKGHHTEQFTLGYVNGSQEIRNNRAEVAGISGLPFLFQNDDKAKTVYDEAKDTRLFVQCGANDPIGTLPVQTDDNYRSFWIGYEDGALLRDNSDPSENFPTFGDCPSGQTAEFCTGWKFGWNFEESQINPPSPGDSKCFSDSIKAPNLVGTWNILNSIVS